MPGPIITVLAAMAAVMISAYLMQRVTRNAGWIDVFWSFGAGASCVVVALWPDPDAHPARQALVAALSALWSARLGLFMALRVSRAASEDSRYASLREEWAPHFQRRLLQLALIQAPVTALLALSVYTAAHSAAGPLGVRDLLGATTLILAIGGETLADEQMRRFKASHQRGAIMDLGLWAWSRHPNYFFQWLGWLAYPVMAFEPSAHGTWLVWIAPALMYAILRYGTGVRMSERLMQKSRGDAFRRYQDRVSVFFPRKPQGQQ